VAQPESTGGDDSKKKLRNVKKKCKGKKEGFTDLLKLKVPNGRGGIASN